MAACLAGGAEGDLAQPKRTVIPLVEKGPALDGTLDDACWDKASRLTNFLDTERLARTVSEQTFVWVLRDRENLYFAFRCLSKDPAKTIAEKTGRDAGRAFKDDVVEIMLDTERTRNDFFHFCVNSIGAIWDAETHRLPATERMISSPHWNSTAEAKGGKEKDAWCVEVRIPLKDLGEKAQRAVREGGEWGFQVARENWSGNEMSTWSRSYAFTEPNDFGVASFAGAPAREEARAWKQEAGASLATTSPPVRRTYGFARIFAFGPETDAKGQPVTVTDPAGTLYVTPKSAYTREAGHGFLALKDPLAAAGRGGYCYGKGYSPLAGQYLGSRSEGTFLFDLPKGRYRTIVTSGSQGSTWYAPIETRVRINDGEATLENPMPFRAFVSKKVEFTADGATPVKADFSSPAGLAWMINHILVYPVADERAAAPAFESLERDFFNYPVEEKVYSAAKVWVEYPPQEQTVLTDEERRAGYAVVNLPVAQFSPRNYSPQSEDTRGPMRAVTSPGERVSMQFGLYAVRPIATLDARLSAPAAATVQARLMQVRYSVRNIGRGTLGQWGYQPRTLWPADTGYDLPAGRFQPYWIVVDVAADAKPGVHTGRVELDLGEGRTVSREFRVTVLPFQPENKKFIWSMFYNAMLGTPGWEKFTEEEKAVVVRMERAYLRDMRRHGIDYTGGGGAFRASYVKEADGRWSFKPCDREGLFIDAMKETGMRQLFADVLGYEAYGAGPFILNEEMQKQGQPPITSPPDRHRCKDKLPPAFFDNLTELVRGQVALYETRGAPTPAFFLWDEPGDVNSPALAPFLDAIHKAGGRTHVTLVAGCYPALHGKVDNRDYNEIALGVIGGEAESPEKILERKRQDGTRYFVYQNGTIMGADPRQARFCFGYWAWAWNLDGLNPYKYWKVYGDPLVGATPFHPLHLETPDRVRVTTTSWEMHAEGVYDNKLVQLLEELTAGRTTPAATEAAAFLRDLKAQSAVIPNHAAITTAGLTGAPVVTKSIWPACRYDWLRTQLVKRIMALNGSDGQFPAVVEELRAIEAEAQDREAQLKARMRKDLGVARKGNLLPLGDFEIVHVRGSKAEGFSRWSAHAAVQSEQVHSGKSALRMVHAAAVPNDSISFAGVPLTPGRQYTVRAWARREADADAVSTHSGFWLHTWGPEGRDKPFVRRMLIAFPKPRPTFDWTKFEYTFTAEPQEKTLEIWLYFVDTKGTVYVDDVELIEIDD
jgi:hypothetical protein